MSPPAFYFGTAKQQEMTRKKSLSWRHDADETLSDWKIIVTTASDSSAVGARGNNTSNVEKGTDSRTTSTDGKESHTFHVHKTVLAVGPRSGDYFARLFRTTNMLSEATTATTEIDLERSAAKAFPIMLDYMYGSPDYPPKFSTDILVALRHLADYFGIDDLFETTRKRIKETVSCDTCIFYLQEGLRYQDDKVVAAMTKFCAENLDGIRDSSLVQLPFETFKTVVTSPDLKRDSEMLSETVAAFCSIHPDMESDRLIQITSADKMATVDPDCALFLLQRALDCNLNTEADQENKCSLRNRCIKAMAKHWHSLSSSDCADLPWEIQVELAWSSLHHAKLDRQGTVPDSSWTRIPTRQPTNNGWRPTY